MISTRYKALSWFNSLTQSSMPVDSIVMMSGLLGLGLIVLGAAANNMDTLAGAADVRTRLAVLSPDYDASACPSGWIESHSAHTGLSQDDLRAWFAQKDKTTDSATILAVLSAHAQAPHDFRYRAPMRLAELQILMCLAERRELPLPAHS